MANGSNGRGVIKSTPVPTASDSLINPAKPQRLILSHAVIAEKAYDIWLSGGQEQGCDQKHWFEAVLQLQRA